MERDFPICIPEEMPGTLRLRWEDLWATASAGLSLREAGICKLWLVGERGRLLLGTLAPEGEALTLKRRFSVGEAKRAGAWPPVGVESMLLWDFDPTAPFPRTDLFCFACVKENRLSIRFDRTGQSVMP